MSGHAAPGRARGITVDFDGDTAEFAWVAAASLPLWARDVETVCFAYPEDVTDEAGMRHREVSAQSAFVAAVGVDEEPQTWFWVGGNLLVFVLADTTEGSTVLAALPERAGEALLFGIVRDSPGARPTLRRGGRA